MRLRVLLQLSLDTAGPGAAGDGARVAFGLNGREVSVVDQGWTLLDTLRELLGCRSPKDGCSPQGQCGCCTVWVDGTPRVACVTPTRRVRGREVTTTEGLAPKLRDEWARAFVDHGASQCGFCTPGIVMRLAALGARSREVDEAAVRGALGAHLCRCTGWQPIVEAALDVLAPRSPAPVPRPWDPLLSSWRAQVEGPAHQCFGPSVVLGEGAGFALDTAPPSALAAVPDESGDFSLAPSFPEARQRTGKVQGRNSTVPLTHPLDVAPGAWALTLRTTWVEPAYLEPDASWCRPGATPASPLANGGAFGGKRRSPVLADARRLADETGQAVRVGWSREDVVRRGPKRPPVAIGLRPDGSGVMRVARTPGSPPLGPLVEAVALANPALVVEEVAVAGPPTGPELRGAGWTEAVVATAGLRALAEGTAGTAVPVAVVGRSGGRAEVWAPTDGLVFVEVWAGPVLDEVVLRSYCIGAVHQALGWVRREGIAVDPEGRVQDLTVRSFGILSARDMPAVTVSVHESDGLPVNASDAVLAATAAAAWIADGLPGTWPTRRGPRDGGGTR